MSRLDRLAIAKEAAVAAGRVLRAAFRQADLEVEQKAQHDFVTSADRAAEAAVLEVFAARCPIDRVLSEERGAVGGSGEYQWIVDPLDGTTNFLRSLPMYAVSIACASKEGAVVGVVFEPERDRMFVAEAGSGAECDGQPLAVSGRSSLDGSFVATGFPFKARPGLDVYLAMFKAVFERAGAIRRCGSAALDLAYTAAGVFDGFFEFRLSAWDIAAGALIIEEAGGVVTDLDGGARYLETGNVLAGTPLVQAQLLEKTATLAGEDKLDLIVPRATSMPGDAC